MRNHIIIVMGKKGSGKSHLTNLLTLERGGDKKTLVYDTMNEYNYNTVDFDTFRKLNKGIFKVSPINYPDEFTLFSSVCEYTYKVGNMVLVVDEIDLYCSANKDIDFLTKICRYGRHKEVDLIAITRRPSDIPRSITAMCDELYIFKIQEPRDIAYLKNFDCNIEEKINGLVLHPEGYTDHIKIIP